LAKQLGINSRLSFLPPTRANIHAVTPCHRSLHRVFFSPPPPQPHARSVGTHLSFSAASARLFFSRTRQGLPLPCASFFSPRHSVPEENIKSFNKTNNNSTRSTNQSEVKEQQPSTEYLRAVCWINRQIILKHHVVSAFSITINKCTTNDGSTVTPFDFGISMHSSSS
jgi:hypothetical protein